MRIYIVHHTIFPFTISSEIGHFWR
jgi:hypothetical protein